MCEQAITTTMRSHDGIQGRLVSTYGHNETDLQYVVCILLCTDTSLLTAHYWMQAHLSRSHKCVRNAVLNKVDSSLQKYIA